MTLREVLHAHVPTLHRLSTVRDAVDRMDVYQFPALVVVDADRRPIAVVTEGDLARAVSAQGELVSLGPRPVMDFAVSSPTLAQPDTEISDALDVMLARGLTILPVAEDGLFLGFVLRMDLMQAILLDVPESSDGAAS